MGGPLPSIDVFDTSPIALRGDVLMSPMDDGALFRDASESFILRGSGAYRFAAAEEMDALFAPWREELETIETTSDALSYASRALLGREVDPLVVDLTTSTQASQGLRSARAIAPGLIPMDFGWHRRRAFSLSRMHRAFEHPAAPAPGAEKLVPHPFP